MTEQTFDFGYGPVPAHRHRNPDGSEGGWVAETARVAETVYVGKDARIWGNARIFDNVRISGNVRICDNAQISDDVRIFGNAQIFGNARICDNAQIWDNAWIFGNARISGKTRIFGNAWIRGSVKISRTEQVLTIAPIGSGGATLTVVFDGDGEIYFGRGCFWGTLAEFREAVERKPEGDKHREIYSFAIEFIQKIRQFKRGDNND